MRRTRKWKLIKHAGFNIRERGPTSFMADCCVLGKRVRKVFTSLDEAKLYCEQRRGAARNDGTASFSIKDRDRLDVVEARKKLGDVPIAQAVEFYLKHHTPGGGARSVSQLVDEYLSAPGKRGRKQIHRRKTSVVSAQKRLGPFVRHCGSTPVTEITQTGIEAWLKVNGWHGINLLHYVSSVRALFDYALRRKYVAMNPALGIEVPVAAETKPPIIMTPKEVRNLLSAAEKVAADLVPRLAVSFFAGLRPNEIEGMDWSNVDLTERIIRVEPTVAKMRRQRLVDVSDNLALWLLSHQKESGPIWPYRSRTTLIRKLDKVMESSKVKVPYNAGRHAFATYHLAHHQDAARTALQMGHTGQDLLLSTYRGLATRKVATEYWDIKPKAADDKIIVLPIAV